MRRRPPRPLRQGRIGPEVCAAVPCRAPFGAVVGVGRSRREHRERDGAALAAGTRHQVVTPGVDGGPEGLADDVQISDAVIDLDELCSSTIVQASGNLFASGACLCSRGCYELTTTQILESATNVRLA